MILAILSFFFFVVVVEREGEFREEPSAEYRSNLMALVGDALM